MPSRKNLSGNTLESVNLKNTNNISSFYNGNHNLVPKNPQYFKKRQCICYVNNPLTNLCAGCKKSIDVHSEINDDITWSYESCTIALQTDAYGLLNFPGSYSKTARYIRVDIETKPREMIEYLYHPEGWNLPKPQLILSVIGGAQKFSIPNRMKKAFKRGLIKAAASTGAWIITGGSNSGVMRLVGEAVADEFYKNNIALTVLGIATWGKVAMRENMIANNVSSQISLNMKENNKQPELFYAKKKKDSDEQETGEEDIYLNSNHSHFILVDDGSEGIYGRELDFRSNIEAELRKGKSLLYYQSINNPNRISSSIQNSNFELADNDMNNTNDIIPMVSIVVQGGPSTLKRAEEAIVQNVPLLILADSKGCADLIVNACSYETPSPGTLRSIIEESQVFDKFKNTPYYEYEINAAIERLEVIISKQSENLINVFRLDSEEGSQDIELTILRAFLKFKENQHFENLKMALEWDRDDIAKTYILTGEEEFKPNQLNYLMEMALIQNKPNFVEILLENGLNLKSFLTLRRLIFLYNSTKMYSMDKNALLIHLYKKKYTNKSYPFISFKGLKKLIVDLLFEDFKPDFLASDLDSEKTIEFLVEANRNDSSDMSLIEEYGKNEKIAKLLGESNFGKDEVSYPEKNLFVWALLMNRIDIAKIFWQIGEHQISTALFASNLLKKMATQLSDYESQLQAYADEFENMAAGVLEIFDNTCEDSTTEVILMQKIPFYGIDCLQIADEAFCLKFISLTPVQNLVTDIWNNPKLGYDSNKKKITNKNQYHNKERVDENLEDDVFENSDYEGKNQEALRLKSDRDLEGNLTVVTSDSSKKANSIKMSFIKLKNFFISPRGHFALDAFFYLLFLCIFSYFILCDLNYYKKINANQEDLNYTLNASDVSDALINRELEDPSIIEYILAFWIISFIFEEISQFIFSKTDSKLKNKIFRYFGNKWNYLDSYGCVLFFMAFTFRLLSVTKNETLFTTARILYAIDLLIWYIRLLQVTIIFKSLGPKLVMIQKMMYDLTFFLIIIAIFVCSFGVTTQATLRPGNEFNLELVKSLINKAYWPIYGDMKILDEISVSDEACKQDNTCLEASGKAYSFIALMIYMVIANVLLINLLIAMFSSTYQDIQVKADQIWKFQRYKLVMEYHESSLLPPPLNYVEYFFELLFLIKRFNCCKSSNKSDEKVKSVELFMERKYAEEFVRIEKSRFRETTSSRLKYNAEKLDTLEQKLNEVIRSRKKESNEVHGALNWIMSQLDTEDSAPYIRNQKIAKK